MDSVMRKQRFNAARLGMLRQWALDKAVRLVKVGTEYMSSDIMTEAVASVKQFQRLARLVLTASTDEMGGTTSPSSEVN